ncbi:YaeQ family protein [Povalibacter sp.]|uniref:YaeQ family protein n=1 Tax=Povalibacter sp. TaxID=1962978 RepID=UPI002F407C99
MSATIFVFDIQLADADRNVYETLSLRVARHPSETNEYLLTRVLAYCLEYTEGVAFSNGGLSDPDAPAITVRDLTGALKTWIEIGSPDAARLHKAGKAAQRVAVYPHRQVNLLLAKLAGERIHRAEALMIYAIDPQFVTALSERLSKRMQLDLSVSEGHLYATVGAETVSGTVEIHRLGQPA